MKEQEVILDDWQKDALEHRGDLLLCTGRQIGKTYIMARKCAERMVERSGTRIIIASLTEDQAKLIIIMILDYLEKHYRRELVQDGKDKPTQSRVCTKNGSTALARPVGNTGDALRGFTGDILVLDEVARFNDSIMIAAKPTLLSTGGEIWMASTPHGKQGYFWESFQNKSKRWKVIYKPTPEAVKERKISTAWTEEKRERVLKFLEDEKKDMSSLQFGQEYEGLFLEDLQQYFPDQLINQACTGSRPANLIGEIYMGTDIARLGGDAITYEFIKAVTETRYEHIENIIKRGQVTTQTEEDIIHYSNIYQPRKIGIDAGSGSLGVGIFDRLMINPKTQKKMVAMNNRSISLDREGKYQQRIFKEDMYDNLKSMMEKGELILLDDESVKQSLKSVQYEYREDGTASKMRIFGSDTHVVEGLIRAAWLAKKEKSKKIQIAYI